MGQNGRVWLVAPTARETVLLLQAMQLDGPLVLEFLLPPPHSGHQTELWHDQCTNRGQWEAPSDLAVHCCKCREASTDSISFAKHPLARPYASLTLSLPELLHSATTRRQRCLCVHMCMQTCSLPASVLMHSRLPLRHIHAVTFSGVRTHTEVLSLWHFKTPAKSLAASKRVVTSAHD